MWWIEHDVNIIKLCLKIQNINDKSLHILHSKLVFRGIVNQIPYDRYWGNAIFSKKARTDFLIEWQYIFTVM